MKKLKKITVSFFTLALAAVLFSCGSEAEPSMNYEQPVRTLAVAMENNDERGYLDCFTAPAVEAFQSDKDYNEEFTKLLYPESANSQRLAVSVLEHTDLDSSATAELEKEFKKTFSRRIKISKAVKLSVRFKLYQKDSKRTDVKDITVVRVDNTWYIYGPVIDEFNFVTEQNDEEDIPFDGAIRRRLTETDDTEYTE